VVRTQLPHFSNLHRIYTNFAGSFNRTTGSCLGQVNFAFYGSALIQLGNQNFALKLYLLELFNTILLVSRRNRGQRFNFLIKYLILLSLAILALITGLLGKQILFGNHGRRFPRQCDQNLSLGRGKVMSHHVEFKDQDFRR